MTKSKPTRSSCSLHSMTEVCGNAAEEQAHARRNLTPVLHRPVEPAPESGQTGRRLAKSAYCHEPTLAPQQKSHHSAFFERDVIAIEKPPERAAAARTPSLMHRAKSSSSVRSSCSSTRAAIGIVFQNRPLSPRVPAHTPHDRATVADCLTRTTGTETCSKSTDS